MTQNSVAAQETLNWQMNFNIGKCAVMHIGINNIQHKYTMANQQLTVTEEQRDLGNTITRDLK